MKPHNVGSSAAFRRVDVLCNLLLFFPPLGSRGKMATLEQWEAHTDVKVVDYAEKEERDEVQPTAR